MTPVEIIRKVAPEFSSIKEKDLDGWVELTMPLVSKRQFGSKYNQALAYLTCHRMKMAGYGDNPDGAVGDTIRITNYAEGGRSVGYAQPANLMTDGDLALTAYGMQYIFLRKHCIVPICVSGGR